MNFQISCIALRITEGHQTGDQGLYTRCNTKGWNLQYHDRPVCQAHGDRKQIHCFCTKQIHTGKCRQNRNALEDHLGTAPDHGGEIHKIQNPDHHGPQKQSCDQGHVKQRRSFQLFEAFQIRKNDRICYSHTNDTGCDRLRQTAKHIV